MVWRLRHWTIHRAPCECDLNHDGFSSHCQAPIRSITKFAVPGFELVDTRSHTEQTISESLGFMPDSHSEPR